MSEKEETIEPATTTTSTAADASDHTLIQQNDACLQDIEKLVKQNQSLTSERVPVSQLLQHYANAPNFLVGVQALAISYGALRMVRGDGNCYYRAFLYSLVEQIITLKPTAATATAGPTILKWLKTDSWCTVLSVGYEELTLELFYDAVVDLMERVVEGTLSLEEFHAEMNQDNGTSDYCTWYMRVITAAHLKTNPDRFLPFILETDCLDIAQFCQRHVEPMGQECEMIQALALAEAFGVQVQIEYLDGHALGSNGKLTHHVVGTTEQPILKLALLYRPGHYDILYPL